MSFKWLTQQDLQEAIGGDILRRLEALSPILDPESADIVQLYRKANLVRLLESFGTASLMRNRDFLRKYLYSIPRDEFTRLCDVTGISANATSYDEQLSALVRKGWNTPGYCSLVCETLGLPAEIAPSAQQSAADTTLISRHPRPFKQLLDYQYRIMAHCAEKLSVPRARLVLQMPTGAGKTRTAFELVAAHLNESDCQQRVVWLAHSEELCEQAIACAVETWEHLGSYDLAIRRIFGTTQARPIAGRSELIVASFQSLYARSQRGEVWDNKEYPASLVVIDEAHKVLAPTYRMVTESLVGHTTKVLGLTATPGRGIDDEFGNQELADFFFCTIVSLTGPVARTQSSFYASVGYSLMPSKR
ncbi:MAG: DEAD/DEAH box helicase family protein [bacterium]|nr:DEAD/DEAH box helicase family protein [bacterium]